jgi:hypothetical protein
MSEHDFSKQILEENILYAIQQFHRFAKIIPIDRHEIVIDILRRINLDVRKIHGLLYQNLHDTEN